MRLGSCLLPCLPREGMAFATFLVLLTPGIARDNLVPPPQTRTCAVHGSIENAQLGARLVVDLEPASSDGVGARTEVDGSNDFSFDEVPIGDYRLRVTGLNGNVIYEEYVSVSDGDNSLVIRLPDQQIERPASDTISVQRLERKIPPKAFTELKKSGEASRKGDLQKSVDHLQRAIQAYPDYVEAHNNLGVCYLRLNRVQEALAEFQKAGQLDPESARVNANLSSVLLMVSRYPEAEAAARRALRSDPSSDNARYILALSLKAQNRAEAEALEDLRRVAPQLPRARLAAAEILVQQGHRHQAIRELRQYLQAAASAADRPAVQSWLAQLQRGG